MSATSAKSRSQPNILVTGTPGTGKTSTAEMISEALGWKHVNVGDVIKEHGFHSGRDDEFDTLTIEEEDEDKLLDHLEPILAGGGIVVDYHSCELFPERWFDLVLVLRTDNTILFDRLVARGYSSKKVSENVECEIMQVVLEEARESYAAPVVQEVPSNTVDDMEATVKRVTEWAAQWAKDHPASA